jgi:hypothetical protein
MLNIIFVYLLGFSAGTLKDLDTSNLIEYSAVTVVVTDSEKTSEGLRPLAGICLFETLGNYIVVFVVRLHN